MDPLLFATRVRSEVEAVTKCPCSVGLGSNMLLARLALKLAKPAGQAILRQDQAEQALEKLQVMELPGVGRNTVAKLASIGACTVGDLRQLGIRISMREWLINAVVADVRECIGTHAAAVV